MFFFLYCFAFINLVFTENFNFHWHNENNLACPENKICIPVDYCSDMATLLYQATLPIHQFRQAICGYVGKNPKVCCNNTGIIRDLVLYSKSQSAELPQDCGRSFVRSDTLALGSYPFLARIGFINLNDGNLKYFCTGTIINERTILTTASCALASANDYKLHSILVGEFDTANNIDCNQLYCAHCPHLYNISYVIIHPNFQRESYDHNIALIRLYEFITFTLTSQPICYSHQNYLFMRSILMLVGWGNLSGNKYSTEQQAIPMDILNEQHCSEFVNRGLSVELCAMGHQEPCLGFNGSPLLHYDEHGRYIVVGIFSYGSSCTLNDNSLSVFVNIQKYAMWISENS